MAITTPSASTAQPHLYEPVTQRFSHPRTPGSVRAKAKWLSYSTADHSGGSSSLSEAQQIQYDKSRLLDAGGLAPGSPQMAGRLRHSFDWEGVMKVLAGTLALSGILALLAACEYAPHDSPEDMARSHDRAMESLTSDIDSTGPAPVYSTSHRATDLLSTPDPVLDLSYEEVRAELGPFAREWARHGDLGSWGEDEPEFSLLFKSCQF